MFWAELLVVPASLIVGARCGGIFLGMSSGVAIAILVFIKSGAADMIAAYPWIFAIIFFLLSAVILSQAGTIGALAPLGITLGITPPTMIGMFPAVNGYFLVPIYATILAGIAFDRTGTTKIGKFVFNHSFQIPGLITCIVSVAVGMALANIVM